MTSRRSSPSSADGFSLIELMIGMTLLLVVTGGALSLSMSSRRLYEMDQTRTRLHQGIRASKDFLSIDIRQAGERLPPDFPAIEILRGEDLPGGTAGSPDELVVRRNMMPIVHNSCRDVSGTDQIIFLAELVISPPPPGCTALPDDDGDGWPDDHKVWSDYRNANGEQLGISKWVWAYMYNPVTRQGEFFKYWFDVAPSGVILTAAGQVWQFNYPVADRPRIYLLEERRYSVADEMLQIVVNREITEPIGITDGVDDFQLLAHFQNSATQDSIAPADDWMDLRAIEIALNTRGMVRGEAIERSWSTMVMPRNVLSR